MNKRQRKKIFKKYGKWLPLPDMSVNGVDNAKVSFFSLDIYSTHKDARRIIKENLNIDSVLSPFIYRIFGNFGEQ